MDRETIERLIANIRLKHKPSFRELYDLTSPKLYGLLYKIIKDRDLAADVLQEVYSKIWINAAKYDAGKGHAWSWICQLSRNAAIDKLRQLKLQPESLEESSREEKTENISRQWQQNIDLNACLAKLKPIPKKAIVLSYIHGFSHIELSRQLDLPLGTLKSWIRRAMKELEVCLKH